MFKDHSQASGPTSDAATALQGNFRALDAHQLILALQQARRLTISLLDDFASALKGLEIDPQRYPEVNPPLWEFGHVAWFQEYWTLRNPQRHHGVQYRHDKPHLPSQLDQADQLYNSAVISPDTRWHVDLEPYQIVRDYLIRMDVQCRDLICAELPTSTNALYFYRLSLAHELMHIESFVTSAQSLGFRPASSLRSLSFPINIYEPVNRQPQHDPNPRSVQSTTLRVPAQLVAVRPSPTGFSFDNELPGCQWQINDFEIDAELISHQQFAQFVHDGGYQNSAYWSADGQQWLAAAGNTGDTAQPCYWRTTSKGIERCWFGQWTVVDGAMPMLHVNLYEAQAWCAWAGRSLPTEAQWLAAANAGMRWGSAWEWTMDAHLPFTGFDPHPYQDYSRLWFGDHQLLKGASWITPMPIHDQHYRNFFRPHRNDIAVGFRSVKGPN
jgi:gamma-glutamyl hercynylcysteine S-oxide synthase